MSAYRFFAKETKNTRDGSFDFSPENILNRQLLFAEHLDGAARWIEYDPKEAEEAIVRRFESKYGVRCTWQEIVDDLGNKWNGYVITEKEPA